MFLELNPFDESSIVAQFQKTDICINLVGVLFEKDKTHLRIFILIFFIIIKII